MEWLANEKRVDIQKILEGCRTVVVAALDYFQETPTRAEEDGSYAAYALQRDYHKTLLQKLEPLCAAIEDLGGTQKAYVDTGAILEKRFAAATALGWQGKSTLWVHPKFGGWTFLGVILTTLKLPTDAPHPQRCGRCQRCLQACPTQALTGPYALDARRCIAYLTIEHKGVIDTELEEKIGTRLFGCDECLRACPWGQRNTTQKMPAQTPELPNACELLEMNAERFAAVFAGSPVKRTGLYRMQRNACIVLGNARATRAAEALRKLARESPDEAVRVHAARALEKIEGQKCSL